MPTILTPFFTTIFAELRALDVAALLDREIDEHRAGFHRRDGFGLDELRRRAARNQRRRDHDVHLPCSARATMPAWRAIHSGGIGRA